MSNSSRCGGFATIPGTATVEIFANGRPGESKLNYITVCGAARCGQLSNSSRCGNFEGSRIDPPEIIIPDDVWTWPLMYVIEREDGEYAQIPIELKEAFEFLTYKIKPLFMWALARVEYVITPPVYIEFAKITPDGFIKMTPDGFIKTVLAEDE